MSVLPSMKTRANVINWPSLAIGAVIMAGFALAIGNIEHSTGLGARSVLLKEKAIDEHVTARSICSHIHFKIIKDEENDWLPLGGWSHWSDFWKPRAIESFDQTFMYSGTYFRI